MTVSSPSGTISDTEATTEDFMLSAMAPSEFFDNPPTPLDPTVRKSEDGSRNSWTNLEKEDRHVERASKRRKLLDILWYVEKANKLREKVSWAAA